MLKDSKKMRIDQLVLSRGLAETREKARGLIMAAKVRVGGEIVDKAGTLVHADSVVEIEPSPAFVGRGGVKLSHALEHFGVDVRGRTALDVGASTGGFTDCLLQRGATHVFALDVGRGQLAYRLRQDARVTVIEQVNAHYPFTLASTVDIVVADVSFISVTKVLPNAIPHLVPGGLILSLVKPQFEAGRAQVDRGGVVKDPLVHGAVLGDVALWAIGQGLRVLGITPSPIYGDKGNREFFILLRKD